MRQKQVLVVDDELAITKVVAYYLKHADYAVKTAANGFSALEAVKATRFDLIILDLMLPDISGLDIARRLKGNADTASIPIIMLTAKVEEEDILTGFELMADDYITKPFSPAILTARVKSILRQVESCNNTNDFYSFDSGLIIFPGTHEVYVNNRKLELKQTECELLVFLAQHAGIALSHAQITAHIKNRGGSMSGRGLDLLIMNLRKKIDPGRKHIHTIRGYGYKFLE